MKIKHIKKNGKSVKIFLAPGKFWKDRWIAWPEEDRFVYFKGTRKEAIRWASEYVEA